MGAAYLAGLAVGYWSSKEDVIKNWAIDKTFEPKIEAEYAEEQERKAQELLEKQNEMKEGNSDDPSNNAGNGAADGKSAQTREQSGSTD